MKFPDIPVSRTTPLGELRTPDQRFRVQRSGVPDRSQRVFMAACEIVRLPTVCLNAEQNQGAVRSLVTPEGYEPSLSLLRVAPTVAG